MSTEIKTNYELKQHSTFKIGGLAEKVYFPSTKEDLIEILKENPNVLVLGNCSNALISTAGIEEDVVITTKINEFEFSGNRVTVNCGAKGPVLSKEAEKLSLSGFEFMIGFPGSFGGMVAMNASAHNQAVSDCFVECSVFNLGTKTVTKLTKTDMDFDYRKSIIASGKYILLDATFELTPCEQEKIEELMQRNLEFRRLRQPSLKLPNVGSIFRNPDHDSAGRLLDLAGAKSLSSGDARVWENHANFIINTQSATSNDVLNLMLNMYNIVKDKYTVELKSEIKFIGIKNAEEEKIWQILSGKNTPMKQK